MPINGVIEYAMVLIEDEYDMFIQYSPIIDITYCDVNGEDEKDVFYDNQKKYEGKSSYINILIDSEAITDDCNDINCEICLNDEEKVFILSKYEYA